MFLALLPPGFVLCSWVNLCAPVTSRLAQLFSRWHSDHRGMWALSTPRERPSIQANAICLNRRALFYSGEWDSAINNWAPEVPLYRPDPFCPPGPAEFFIIFSWNSERFFDSKKFIWSASLWPRLSLKRNPKITAGPVVLLTSKNDQKKH